MVIRAKTKMLFEGKPLTEKQKKYISTSVFFVFVLSLCIFAIVVIIGAKANQRLETKKIFIYSL